MNGSVVLPRRGPPPLVACPECDALHVMVRLPERAVARCRRCEAVLYRTRRGTVERARGFLYGALPLLLAANLLPFMTLEIEGRQQPSTLLSGAFALWRADQWLLAALVFLVMFLIPTSKLLASLYVLDPLARGRPRPGAARIFREVERLHPWSMMEVYLLGVLVAWVKLRDVAEVHLGPALFAFVGLIVLLAAAEAVLEPFEVWERLGPQARGDPARLARRRDWLACEHCHQLVRLPTAVRGLRLHCPRCEAVLHRRKPDAVARSWALLLAATALYVPANVLPIMRVTWFGRGEPDTILSGVQQLLLAGMWPLAAVVFFASIVVPVLKIMGLAFLLVSVQLRSRFRPRDRARIYRIVEAVGRWSMVDVFMIAILTALVSVGQVATIEPGPGATAFALVVILTMLASHSFDPRAIWDASGDDHGHSAARH